LKSEIFDRIGMNQSVVLEAPGQPIERRAMGYSRGKSGQLKPSCKDTRTFGDGQVMTTALDLVKWDRALSENALVKAQTQSLAFTSGKLSDGKPCGYGFGWYVGGKDGRTVEHGGKWFGTSTYILRHLDSGITVIVLSNLEQFPARKVAADIAALAEVPG
jgi:CubicO group peptidase (beta-lactamase class C family)